MELLSLKNYTIGRTKKLIFKVRKTKKINAKKSNALDLFSQKRQEARPIYVFEEDFLNGSQKNFVALSMPENWYDSFVKFYQCRILYQSIYYDDLGDSVILNHKIMIFENSNFPAAFSYPEKNAINSCVHICHARDKRLKIEDINHQMGSKVKNRPKAY